MDVLNAGLRGPFAKPMRSPFAPGARTPTQRAIAVLRKFGADAHVYLPGVGMLNGLQAGNYLESTGVTPGAVDQPVGLVLDAAGGIHASQPTTSAKPILRRGAVNLLTYSGDFANAAWIRLDIAVSVGLFAGPDGSLSSRKITELATADYHQFSQVISPVAGTYTQAVICKSSGASHITLNPINQGNAFSDSNNRAVTFDLATGAMTQVNGTGVTHSTLALGNGFYLFTATATTVVNSLSGPTVRLSNTATPGSGVSYTGTETSGIFVQSVALFQGTLTAAQIQALGGIPLTTTAPASTALGPQHWEFDGSNDSLSLGGPLFQMADDHWVVAVASAESLASSKHIFNNCNGSVETQRLCNLAIGTAGSPIALWRDDAGTLASIQHAGTFAPGTRWVITGIKRGNDKQLRVNGVQSGATNTTALGVTTATSAIIGAYLAGGIGAFSGPINVVMGGKGTLTDAEILLIEKFAASTAGVTI